MTNINYDEAKGWSAIFQKPEIRIENIGSSLDIDGKAYDLKLLRESSSKEFEDSLGSGTEFKFISDMPVRVSIYLRQYQDRQLLGIKGRLENSDRECKIFDFTIAKGMLINLGCKSDEISVHLARGIAHPNVVPLVEYEEKEPKDFRADSNGMATLADKNSGKTLTAGFITGLHHRPIVSVEYVAGSDELRVNGTARYNGVTLSPGEIIETDTIVIQAADDPFLSLESYADLIAKAGPCQKKDATTGWCSWYAIRLPISHEFTMANARVTADRFRDLGMDIMLLDHGWQTGDICGDWDEDKNDYPEGLSGLADDLENLGLKLGIWIAPTEVAETSKLFRDHPDWVLRDKDGKPQMTWKWYWAPNPPQYQIDATHSDAYKYIVDTFRRLTSDGSVYYKIDFISGCSGENLYPCDPKAVRGWTPLQKAMLAVREGAGNTYVRYCQTPPLLSNGIADGVFATNDTLDAGATTWNVLREVFRMSSAEYYLHKLYNHDACDLSIRAHAGTEECRLRVMMLALSGSSIMFSDDLTKLPEERIVMMQQSMPPFQKAAKPINLFTSQMPDIWHLRCSATGIEWDLLALFNFDESQRNINVPFKELGLPDGEDYIVREFWTEDCEIMSGSGSFIVPGLSARLYSIWRQLDIPQYVGTNLHLSQGEAELKEVSYDGKRLYGILSRAKGIYGKVYFRVPSGLKILRSSHPVRCQNSGLWAMEISFDDKELQWEIDFQ